MLPSLDIFPADARAFVEGLLAEPLLPVSALRQEVETHHKLLREAHLHRALVPYELAGELAEACLALLWMVREDTPEDMHRLVQVAVHYFTLDSDARGDFAERGLDDDREVVLAVCRHLGRTDLLAAEVDGGPEPT